MEVRVGPAVITAHVDDEILICEPDASLSSDCQQGYFIADTRLVSGYRLKIGRVPPVLLNSSQIRPHSTRFEFTNPPLLDDEGEAVPEHTLHLRIDRALGRGLHEDYDLTNYSGRSIDVVLQVSIESDFADIFDVKDGRLQRRGIVQSFWDAEAMTLSNHFRHDGFVRTIEFSAHTTGAPPAYANGGMLFPLKLDSGESWHACLLWKPVFEEMTAPTIDHCHDLLGRSDAHQQGSMVDATKFITSDPEITETVKQAVDDLVGLRMRAHVAPRFLDLDRPPAEHWPGDQEDFWVPAAGVPWFVSLFGRDALTTSLQAITVSYRFAEGSLRALALLQGDRVDDDRDMQPGKIEHELRRGELARLKLIPHTPYYGTHDATPLFILTAATTWRWHGDREELDRLRPHVEAALAWIDRDGDLDGDGIQEYMTRSSRGYFNQGWKDAFDAILHADGSMPELPIATCELQGVVVAAKRAWAEVLERSYGETLAAQRLRDEADRLADLIEKRFWWEAEGTYYLGLDGLKRPIESVASNAGHLLYYGAVDSDRARRVAKRLFAEDLWSGWGIRTLSAAHPSYNPFSYQLGSVWPHDNVIIAAGLRRYGLDREAQTIARSMFDAAASLVNRQLPELFAGLHRDEAAFPVQYLGANVPQAWASGAVIQLIDVLLGFDPDVGAGELRMRPALPEWLDTISVSKLLVGDSRLDFKIRREGGHHVLELKAPDKAITITLTND